MKKHLSVISAQSGGCSGYLYDMKIIEKPEDKIPSTILEALMSIFTTMTKSLLNGLELDFKDTLMGGGFNITNPNASRECGCGQSFG